MARHELRMGFVVWIQVARGVTPAGERSLERALLDYLDAHELACQGTQLRWAVGVEGRSLSAADQADLLNWLVDQEPVGLARMSPLTPRPDPLRDIAQGWLTLCRLDPCVEAATRLFRFGRLAPEEYLQALGGYAVPILG